jgi:G3E family GTPase
MKNTQLTEYTVPQGVKATKTALILPEGLSTHQWEEIGRFLRGSHDSLMTWEADWLRYGKANYDEATVSNALTQLEFPLHALERFQLIAEVEPKHRHHELTEEHYLVVAKRCETEKQRESWLNTAAIEKLTPRELQASIRAKEVVRIDMDKRSVSLPSPYAALREYKAWQREWGEGYKRCTEQELDDILATIRPMFDFYCEVAAYRAKLGEK